MMGYVKEYFAEVARLMDRIPVDGVERMVSILADAWQSDKRVLLMGNGGSSATASHIVNDLQKCIRLEAGRALKTLCLSDCTPLVMAWANDTSYDNVFAPQVECWAEPGDVIIAISGSGNSPNVLRGVEAATAKGAATFALTGCGGGKLAAMASDGIVVESDNMQQIEDLHMVVLHLVFSELRDRLSAQA